MLQFAFDRKKTNEIYKFKFFKIFNQQILFSTGWWFVYYKFLKTISKQKTRSFKYILPYLLNSKKFKFIKIDYKTNHGLYAFVYKEFKNDLLIQKNRNAKLWEFWQKQKEYKINKKIRKRKTLLKAYLYFILAVKQYTYGLAHLPFQRRFLRNSLNLKHSFKLLVEFKRHKRFRNFKFKINNKITKKIGFLNNLLYFFRFQFFMIIKYMELFGYESSHSMDFFVMVDVADILYTIIAGMCEEIRLWFITRRWINIQKNLNFSELQVIHKLKKFADGFFSLYLTIYSEIMHFYDMYVRKIKYQLRVNIIHSTYRSLYAKAFIKSGFIKINGKRQRNIRKQLFYGDVLYINPRHYFCVANSFRMEKKRWYEQIKFRNSRSILTLLAAPWCSFVVNDVYQQAYSPKLPSLAIEKFPKKYFEILFVLYRQ